MEFKQIVNKRYATKKFDGRKIDDHKLQELLEMVRMSASSFGLQPYKIKIIADRETKDKLLTASWNQPQISTCSHLLIFCADNRILERINEYGNLMEKNGADKEKVSGSVSMMEGFVSSLSIEQLTIWATKQCYIALGNAINGATSLGFDSCPMEGFNSSEYAKILKLPEHLTPVVICPIGYAADTPKPKLRFSKENLFF